MAQTRGGNISKVDDYPQGWEEFATSLKKEQDWKCERCRHPHDRASGHVLTVHHLTGNKQESFKHKWAFAVLCQRCHLAIQGRVKMDQLFMENILNVSDWFRPHLDGYTRFIKEGK